MLKYILSLAALAATSLIVTNTTAQTAIQNQATDSTIFISNGTKTMVLTPSGQLRMGSNYTLSSSALMQLNSTTQGFLVPRMTGTQVGNIVSPAPGLIVYNTTLGKLVSFDGSAWVSYLTSGGSAGWSTGGNSGTVDGTDFIGTIDDKPLTFRVNNIKAGRIEADNGSNTGGRNTFFGVQSGLNNAVNYAGAQGVNNNGFGYQSLASNTTGGWNAAVGTYALQFNTTGDANVAFGFRSLWLNTTGGNNTAYGYGTLQSNTAGYYNTALGSEALRANTTGIYNLGIGPRSLYNSTIGNYNTALGNGTLNTNVAGSNATAVGYGAMQNSNNTSTAFDNYNVAVGYEALRGSATPASNTGNSNTAVGYQSLMLNSTGDLNSSSGYYSLNANTTGAGNAAFGAGALRKNTTGNFNSATGYESLRENLTGANNTSNGYGSLYNTTTGSNNTAMGYTAGYTNTTGTNNTAIGYGADVYSSNLTNATAIGANASVAASNAMVFGGTGANAVSVAIGTTTPLALLDVTGDGGAILIPRKSTAGDPTGINGMIYYNTNAAKFRVFQNNAWADWVTPAASGWGLTGNSGTLSQTNFVGTTDNRSMNFRTYNANRMIVDSLGRVGIGTTTALGVLDVGANIVAANAWSYFRSNTNGVSPSATFTNGLAIGWNVSNGDGETDIVFGNGAGVNKGLVFGEWNGTTFTPDMKIRVGGNVGIGTTAPSQKLNVENGNILLSNTGTAGELRFAEPNASGINFTSFKAGAQTADITYTLPATGGSGFLSNDGTGSLSWSTSGVLSGGTANYLARWTSANTLALSAFQDDGTYIGLGATPSSTYKLYATVAGTTHTIYGENTGSGDALRGFVSVGSGKAVRGDNNGSGNAGYFQVSSANSSSALRVDGNGTGNSFESMSTGSSGSSGYFSLSNASNSSSAISVYNSGSGEAGSFQISNSSNSSDGINVSTDGSGYALNASNSGIGQSGYFSNSNSANTSDGLSVLTNGRNSVGLRVTHTGISGAGTDYAGYFTNTGSSASTANVAGYFAASGATSNYAIIVPSGAGNVGIGTSTPNNILQVANYVNFDPAYSSTSLGYTAGNANTAAAGTFVGYNAGTTNSTGDANTFVGYSAGTANTSGRLNTYVGYNSAYSSVTGDYNSYFGIHSGYNMNAGTQNTLLGASAGSSGTGGSGNTMVGYATGPSGNLGSNNTYLGINASGTAGLTNATAIGAGASVTANSSLVLGSGVNVGIGISNPSYKLHVVGDINLTANLRANGTAGTASQVLGISAGNTAWVTLTSAHLPSNTAYNGGTATTNTLTKYNVTGQLVNSGINDNGTTIAMTGNATVSGTATITGATTISGATTLNSTLKVGTSGTAINTVLYGTSSGTFPVVPANSLSSFTITAAGVVGGDRVFVTVDQTALKIAPIVGATAGAGIITITLANLGSSASQSGAFNVNWMVIK